MFKKYEIYKYTRRKWHGKENGLPRIILVFSKTNKLSIKL